MAFTGNHVCAPLRSGLWQGQFDFSLTSPDVYKIALYTELASLNANTAAYTTANEVSAPGYAAGGLVLVPSTNISGAVSFISFANVTWNAALTARGALIYKVGDGNPALIVLDFGSNKTSTTSFVIQFPPANNTSAILRLA
jgi:hypothetical protein